MSVKYFFIPLVLIVIPTVAAAHSDLQSLAYLSILIPISFLPFILGLQRILFDIKKYQLKLKGSVLVYLLISLTTCLLAVVLFSKIGIVHYFMLVTIGPLLGFLLFQARLKSQLKKKGAET